MALHLRSRQRPARARRVGSHARVLLLCAALASAVAAVPHARAQDNGAQGNGAQGNGKNAAPNNNANGAPARKTAAQRTQDDAQRLLGGPSTSLGGYNMEGSTPDSQRDALLNSERMRVAKPNTQTGGGPTAAAGGDGAAAPAAGIRRPARGGAAAGGAGANGGAAGGVAAQRAAAANTGGGTAVYSDPYSARAGREVFKSPW